MNRPETALSDIVKRLRWTALHGTQEHAIDIMREAADEIERLRAALTTAQDHIHIAMHEMDPHKQDTALMDAFDATRAALEPKP